MFISFFVKYVEVEPWISFSKKTVVVSLWNVLATDIGQKLLDMADESPIVAIKSLKVSDFQGNNI